MDNKERKYTIEEDVVEYKKQADKYINKINFKYFLLGILSIIAIPFFAFFTLILLIAALVMAVLEGMLIILIILGPIFFIIYLLNGCSL